jgi:hypothetical protein
MSTTDIVYLDGAALAFANVALTLMWGDPRSQRKI